jgi:hypothetical protein
VNEAEGDVQMWRTRRELLGAVASLLIMMASLGGCLIIILFSWPDPEHRRPIVAIQDVPMAIGDPVLIGAEVVPAVHGTASTTIVQPRR